MLSYWFYPNPGGTEYSNPKVVLVLGVCALMFLLSFIVGKWSKKNKNSVTKRLSKGWSGKMRVFSVLGAVLVVCKVEEIQFFAMRFLWVVWLLALVAYVLFQIWMWKKKALHDNPEKRSSRSA